MQRTLFAAKERQDYVAAGTSDFGPRRYHSAIPLWAAPDRKASDYADKSPYTFCGANPIKNVDPSGDDVVVLLAKNYMHLAMLIQHEDGNYYYYSINGRNKDYPLTGFVGGRRFDDIAVGPFSSPEDFMQSDYNSPGEADDKNSSKYGFHKGFHIPTSQIQDKTIAETFKDISTNETYGLLWNNCATTVGRSLMKADINTGLIPNPNTPLQFIKYFLDRLSLPQGLLNTYLDYINPINVYEAIKFANPNGKEYKRKF